MKMRRERIYVHEIRQDIIDAISMQYGMNVSEFANSHYPRELGLTQQPNSICSTLADTGSVSFPIFKALYGALGLGVLERETVVERTNVYTVTKK